MMTHKEKLFLLATKLGMRISPDIFLEDRPAKNTHMLFVPANKNSNLFSAYKNTLDGIVLAVSNYEINADDWVDRNGIKECNCLVAIEIFETEPEIKNVENPNILPTFFRI